MPRVSIISAFHKRRDVVRMTMESIVQQDFADFEALIWDDGSCDGTYEEMCLVAEELGDSRIKVYCHNPNKGLTAGLNDAIARAQGEYVAVWGSGDESAPDRLSKQVAALDGDPEAVLCASRSITVDEITGRRFVDEQFDKLLIQRDDITKACPFTHGSVMYRKSTIDAVAGYRTVFKWCADWDIFFRLLANGHGRYVPEDLYIRYARADGVSFSPKKAVDQIQCKHLALELSTLSHAAQEALCEKVRHEGLKSAIAIRSDRINDDLRARYVKLVFMNRSVDARELRERIDAEYPNTLKWRMLGIAASILAAMPISQDRLINIARKSRR